MAVFVPAADTSSLEIVRRQLGAIEIGTEVLVVTGAIDHRQQGIDIHRLSCVYTNGGIRTGCRYRSLKIVGRQLSAIEVGTEVLVVTGAVDCCQQGGDIYSLSCVHTDGGVRTGCRHRSLKVVGRQLSAVEAGVEILIVASAMIIDRSVLMFTT